MSLQIQFDNDYSALPPTLVLAKRNGSKIGAINAFDITVSDELNTYSELSFTVYKTVDNEPNPYWDDIKDFRLIWCKEWDIWYELNIDTTESSETIKKCTLKTLAQSELSKVQVHKLTINTEAESNIEGFIPTVFYSSDKSISLLDRILAFAPHYTIKHVDAHLASIINTYNFDNKSVYDVLIEIANNTNVLIRFNNGTTDDGKIERSISVYDLLSHCNDCGYRGEFKGSCPDCGSLDIGKGYGNDTTVYIDVENLADSVDLKTNDSNVYNCFKLDSGDDTLNEIIKQANINGTDYIWHITDEVKADMSDALRESIDSYDEDYSYGMDNQPLEIDSDTVETYNALIEKYLPKKDDLHEADTKVIGYRNLLKDKYDAQDFLDYLQSGMMAEYEFTDDTAEKQALRINGDTLSPLGIKDFKTDETKVETIASAVTSAAETLVSKNYKVTLPYQNFHKVSNTFVCQIHLENQNDKEDVASAHGLAIEITNDKVDATRRAINKIIHDEGDSTEYDIVATINSSEFEDLVKEYNLDTLNKFKEIILSCMDSMIQDGLSDRRAYMGKTPDMYDLFYFNFDEKRKKVGREILKRTEEIETISKLIEVYNQVGADVQESLNFESYIGSENWKEFVSFRREYLYKSSNYSTSGLTHAQINALSRQFLNEAKNELIASATLQHSITAKLQNLLVLDAFKPIVNMFEVGNWIRIKADDKLFKLRLLSYKIDFDDLDMIEVEFSDVREVANGVSDVRSILDKAQSIASTFASVDKRAQKGAEKADVIERWFTDGLNATLCKIVNDAQDQEMQLDNHGLLLRRKNYFLDSYYDEQLKIINSTIAFTNDDWATTKTAIGKFLYEDPTTGELVEAFGVNGETVIGKLILGQDLGIYNSGNTLKFDANGLQVTNGTNTFCINPNLTNLVSITKGTDTVFTVDENGNLSLTGNINATSGTIGGLTVTSTTNQGTTAQGGHFGTNSLYIHTSDDTQYEYEAGLKADGAPNYSNFYVRRIPLGHSWSEGEYMFYVTNSGKLYAGNADLKGTITATSFTAYGSNEATRTVIGDNITIYNSNAIIEPYISIRDTAVGGTFVSKLTSTTLTLNGATLTGGSNLSANKMFAAPSFLMTGTSSDIYIEQGTDTPLSVIKYYNSTMYFGANENMTVPKTILRGSIVRLYTTNESGGGVYLGSSGSTAVTSDETLKDIYAIDDRYIDFFDKIDPVVYKYKVGHRKHLGFGAQSVERALLDSGLTTEDFAGVLIDEDVTIGEGERLSPDGKTHFNKLYSMRYEEFIALNTLMIKQLRAENKALTERIKKLEGD